MYGISLRARLPRSLSRVPIPKFASALWPALEIMDRHSTPAHRLGPGQNARPVRAAKHLLRAGSFGGESYSVRDGPARLGSGGRPDARRQGRNTVSLRAVGLPLGRAGGPRSAREGRRRDARPSGALPERLGLVRVQTPRRRPIALKLNERLCSSKQETSRWRSSAAPDKRLLGDRREYPPVRGVNRTSVEAKTAAGEGTLEHHQHPLEGAGQGVKPDRMV